MGATAFIDTELLNGIEKSMQGFEAIYKTKALKAGMEAAVLIPARRTAEKLKGLLPYKGDKKNKPPLYRAVDISVKQNFHTGQIFGRVRWNYFAGGQHGHLVEAGHRIVLGGKKGSKKRNIQTNTVTDTRPVTGFVKGKRYLAESWAETRQAQMAALEAGVAAALEEIKQKG